MTIKEDQDFDQFLKSKMGRPKEPPGNEWQKIHSEVYSENQKEQGRSFVKFWPAAIAAVFSLSLVFYNYSLYNSSDVDELLNFSFSSDQSWGSSTTLIDISSNENT